MPDQNGNGTRKPSNKDLFQAIGVLVVFIICLVVFGLVVRELDAAMRNWSIQQRDIPSTVSP